MLNRSRGNMYEFVTHTWNAIKGRCPHDCSYCYMKIFKLGELRFDEKEMETAFPDNSFIFVGSSCDMFAEAVPEMWIVKTLEHCQKFPKARFLFQSKNPKRIYEFREHIPKGSVIATTIETNRRYPEVMNNSPDVRERALYMRKLADEFDTTVTIEPIMDFDTDELASLIRLCRPKWVTIGADSKNHNLPEPSKEKVLELADELRKFTTIEKKRNMERLLQ